MSLLGKVFGKKKELTGSEIKNLFDIITVDREPVIFNTGSFKFVSDIITQIDDVFHVKNNLTRDEVMYELKGKKVQVQFPYELTLYAGVTAVKGLSIHNGVHTLKFAVPSQLQQEEQRGAYRVSTFRDVNPTVTFTSDQTDLIRARLMDISMTGAGLRLDPRYLVKDVKLNTRATIILDIKISDHLRISTTAQVRYFANNKLGVQFADLDKGVKDRLFKFIVEARRIEYRAMQRVHQRINTVSEPGRTNENPGESQASQIDTGKPVALLVGEDEELVNYLSGVLNRKFDLAYSGFGFGDIRSQCGNKPSMCLIELRVDDPAQVAQMKKASQLIPPGCVLMYYGENLDQDFRDRFISDQFPADIIVDVQGRKKLMLFKQIERYWQQKSPK